MLSSATLVDGLVWYVVFLFSTTCHEAAHAFAAMKLGDLTAYHGGQVTLDPLPHIRREPIGTVVVPILSFLLGGTMIGWASAPYNPQWALQYPRRSAIMALAGPAANLLLILFAVILIRGGIALGYFVAPDSLNFEHLTEAVEGGLLEQVATFVSVLFTLNLILFALNLIPLPPLDGSGAIPLLLSDNAARKYMQFVRSSGLAIIGLIVVFKFFGNLFSGVYSLALRLLYPEFHYE